MKKTLSLVLSLLMILSTLTVLPLTAFAGDGGTTGECTWSYSNGTLTITGPGAMADYEYDSETSSYNRPWESYVNAITKLEIKYGVTEIGNYAFLAFNNLEKIETPYTTTRIGEWAFAYCRKVKQINVRGSDCVIETSAFDSCEDTVMNSISIYGVKTIGESAFYECDSNNIYLGEGLERIEFGAFSLNESVTEITFPTSLKFIDDCAFASCDKLTRVVIPNPDCEIVDELGTIYDKATIHGFAGSTAQQYAVSNNRSFFDISKGECGPDAVFSFDIKTGTLTVTGNGATYDSAYFDYAPYIKKIVIGSGITELKGGCFSSLENLKEAVLPDSVEAIGNWAFEYCNQLEKINLPKNLKTIGKYAFIETNLKSVVIPNGVTEIGESAFDECRNLKSVTVPRSVTVIGGLAFGYANAVKIPGFVLKIYCDSKKTVAQAYAEEFDVQYELIHTLNDGTVLGHDSKTYTVKHICKYCGEVVIKTYNKKANTLTVKAKKPTVKLAKLKKKNQTIARKSAIAVSKAQGKVTYKKSSGNKKITVSKAGKITVKKGLKKGTYKVKIKVTAAGNATYKAKTKTVTVKIKVR